MDMLSQFSCNKETGYRPRMTVLLNGVAFRSKTLVWGALFSLVAAGCATGIFTPEADGGGGVAEASTEMDASTDAGKPDTGRADAGNTDTGSSNVCADWAGPTVAAGCTDMCNTTTHICGANGCYNMWWCKISTGVCSAKPPAGC